MAGTEVRVGDAQLHALVLLAGEAEAERGFRREGGGELVAGPAAVGIVDIILERGRTPAAHDAHHAAEVVRDVVDDLACREAPAVEVGTLEAETAVGSCAVCQRTSVDKAASATSNRTGPCSIRKIRIFCQNCTPGGHFSRAVVVRLYFN